MKVELMQHTADAEFLVTRAMLGCQSTKAASDLLIQPDIADRNNVIERMLKQAITSGHESVLEHAVFTFSVQGISRDCSHQLVRHRIASYSQQSQRHVDPTNDPDWFVLPDSISLWEDAKGFPREYERIMHLCAQLYKRLIVEAKVPKEDARFVLPGACKTNIVITMNARELRHFFKLRRAKEAQWEIRDMANLMHDLVMVVAPRMFGDV